MNDGLDAIKSLMAISQTTRSMLLPITMIIGAVFHGFFGRLGDLQPYLIFTMLFISFTKVSASDLKVGKLHIILLAFQLLTSFIIYYALRGWNETVAQGLMICAFTPMAMAAMVIASMLGANPNTIATYSLLSNISVAVMAPIVFSYIGVNTDIPFWNSLGMIVAKVAPLLILPFAGAWFLEKVAPKAHAVVRRHQDLSFWIWCVAVTIAMGRTVSFIIEQPASNYATELFMTVGALLLCLINFSIGRHYGVKYGDPAAGGQALGQKNTILAIWMSQIYLEPLASIAPAAYLIWQNIVNSAQLYRYKNAVSVALQSKSKRGN